MANQQINLNQVPSEPSLKDLLDYFKKEVKLEINCHHIGTIQSFNATNQTATATINYTKTFIKYDFDRGFVTTQVDYPILADCPCIVLGGGDGALTFPITIGDECLILFNDRDIDTWFSGSSSSPVSTPRTHAFTDGIVLVGIRSKNNVLAAYDTDAVTLKKGDNTIKIFDESIKASFGTSPDVYIKLEEDKVTTKVSNVTFVTEPDKITATVTSSGITFIIDNAGKLTITNATGEFVAALVKLMQDIQAATASGFPLIMPTFVTDLAVLQSFKA